MASWQDSPDSSRALVPTNSDYTNEYLEVIDDLDGDIDSRRAFRLAMNASTAIYHDEVVEATFVPRLFNPQAYETFKNAAETIHRILCKVIDHYVTDPTYRRVFTIDPRLEELILLPRGYEAHIPFARVDTFLDENTHRLAFCEFNADGSSGMNEIREVTKATMQSESFKTFQEHHKLETDELFDSWVDTFIAIYQSYDQGVDSPRFAICDYLDHGVVDEFKIYAERFEAHGYPMKIVDVRDLTFDGETLWDQDQQPIHGIWRRCVTNDVLEYWSESQDFINAVRAHKVALIGSFAGHLVHDKQIFQVLLKPETFEFLESDEIAFLEQTIPTTDFLSDDKVNLDQIRAHKDEWIIKPVDHYGADQVYAGCFYTQEEWEDLIDRHANGKAGFPFLVQRYIKPYQTLTLPPDKEILTLPDGAVSSIPVPYNNLTGLYLYNGHFQGIYCRLGPYATICKDMDGVTAASFWIDRC